MFTDMLSKCDTLVAHNTAFDLQIIERALKFHNVNFVKPRKIYCTMMTG
jgi:DNA polymerase III epsilon subunit-like protein